MEVIGKVPDRFGYLIACRKRQQYVKLCEADLENSDPSGWRPGGRPIKTFG
jgi:hypothetical protein